MKWPNKDIAASVDSTITSSCRGTGAGYCEQGIMSNIRETDDDSLRATNTGEMHFVRSRTGPASGEAIGGDANANDLREQTTRVEEHENRDIDSANRLQVRMIKTYYAY